MVTFKQLGLNSEIIKSLDDLGFTQPTPIQEKAILFLLKSKKDLIALAQTGTGKTAAFSLPILNQIKPRANVLEAIIICPTRELCLQISKDIRNLGKYVDGLKVTSVYGGERMDVQIKALKSGTNIVVGTPGRVHDMIRRNVLKLVNIKWVVLDEADEMLDMGFKQDLEAILGETSKSRQTMLFSATMQKNIYSIAKKYMNESEEISIGEKNKGADNVSHEYYVVQSRDRFEALKRILESLPGVYGILFCRTRRETQELAEKLKHEGYSTEALNGDINQRLRTRIMDRFKNKQVSLLVATDVAARGIDVSNLSHVINYNLPDQNDAYTHRSGRTGRAQNSGVSITIVTSRDIRKIKMLEAMVGKKFEFKKVPNKADIYVKQIDQFIEEIKQADISSIKTEKSLSEIKDKMKKLTKDELVDYFIATKFNKLLNGAEDSRDLNTDAFVAPVGRSSGQRRRFIGTNRKRGNYSNQRSGYRARRPEYKKSR